MSNLNTALFNTIPQSLSQELLDSFKKIEKNYREKRWEPSELNGGKFCEIVYTILKGYLDGSFPATASKPNNMVDACKNLEQNPATFPRSIRIQIPRMIPPLYEIRNNRGVGHVGGDVNPNKMDATVVLQMAKWILSELIRAFHNLSIADATAIVDSISERETTIIWDVDGKLRVLKTELTYFEQTLILLYGSPAGVSDQDLIKHLEPSNNSTYRSNLKKQHKKRIIEYNTTTGIVKISPLGIEEVETKLL